MRRSLVPLLVTLLSAFLFTACATAAGALTPEDAARPSMSMPPESAATFRVLGKRPWERGQVVLYTYLRPASDQEPPMQIFGYSLVEPSGLGMWRSLGGGAGGSDAPPAAGDLISYGYGWDSSIDRGDLSIVYGQALGPQVAAVEVTFDDGRVLRDGAEDGVFAVTVAAKVAICELRVLDAQGAMLQRLVPGWQNAPDKLAGEPPTRCPPETVSAPPRSE